MKQLSDELMPMASNVRFDIQRLFATRDMPQLFVDTYELIVTVQNLRGKHFPRCTRLCLGGDFNLCPQTEAQGGYDRDDSAFQELKGTHSAAPPACRHTSYKFLLLEQGL